MATLSSSGGTSLLCPHFVGTPIPNGVVSPVQLVQASCSNASSGSFSLQTDKRYSSSFARLSLHLRSLRPTGRRLSKCSIRAAVAEGEAPIKVINLDEGSSKSSLPSDKGDTGVMPVLKPSPKPVLRSPPRPVLQSPSKPSLQPQARAVSQPQIKSAIQPQTRPSQSRPVNGMQANRPQQGSVANKPGTYTEVYKPGEKPLKPNTDVGTENFVKSLDEILEKVEELSERMPKAKGSTTMGRQSFQNVWRRPVKDEPANKSALPFPSPPPPRNNDFTSNSSVIAASPIKNNEPGPKVVEPVQSKVVEPVQPIQTTSSQSALLKPRPVQRPQPQVMPKPMLTPKPAPKPTPKSPELQQEAGAERRGPILRDIGAGPQQDAGETKAIKAAPQQDAGETKVRKGPILKDIGAAPMVQKKEGTSKKKEPGKSQGAADAVVATPKFTKGGKGKEDKRKKQDNDMDGGRRKSGSRMDQDDEGIVRGGRKYNKARRKAEREEAAKAAAPVRVDILEVGKVGMSVQDLAQKLAVNDSEVIKTLFMKGVAVAVTQTLDEETVRLVCQEFGVDVIEAGSIKVEDMAKKRNEFLEEDDLDYLEARPPIVTVMGHVDHGKTSLLDYIRKSKVAAGEAGGITQGIGAYRVSVSVEGTDQTCVFLDTPGHQAFSAMRARGARVTDVAIIVVAADDGVRPQTNEAIAHAKAANVPIVVAINKIDKDGASPERVMQELSSLGLMPEEWGGDVPMIPVSALTGKNVDTLLETVMLVSELQDLKANPNRSAKGTIIEASLDKTKGALATFLVQTGTLRKGDVILCGDAYGKVRAMFDESGAQVSEASPSSPVQVIGLNKVPSAGDEFEISESLDEAREKATAYAENMRETRLAAQAGEGKITLVSLASAVSAGKETGVETHQLNVILKVDVQGAVEAIREALQVLPQESVQLRFLLQASGDISASDIDLAIASEAIVLGFNVGIQPGVQAHAESEGVEVRLYRVIYELIDDMRKAMEGLLEPVEEQVAIGNAEVRAVFSSGSGKAAGCMVTEGKLVKGCGIQVRRNKKIVYKGSLTSLRRVKEVAKEVDAGLECGVVVEEFNEWEQGDVIEAFNIVSRKKTLEDASADVNAVIATTNVSK